VRSTAPEHQRWLVQPLLDAGLDLDEIRALVFRLGFESIAEAEQGAPRDLMSLVADQPAAVRAAWAEMIDRMVAVAPSAPDADRVG
jgi:hypothetical protein